MTSRQTIHREEHRSNFTTISNETLRDKRLSPKTAFVLVSIIGLPTDWKITDRGLATFLGVGKDLVNAAVQELVKLGYATREAIRNSRGQITEWVTQIFERPNLDAESIVSRSHSARSGSTRSGETGHIQSKVQTNHLPEKENIKTPLISPKPEPEEEGVQNFEPPEPEPEPEPKTKGLTPLFAEELAKVYGKASNYLKGIRSAAAPVEKPKKRLEQPMGRGSSDSESQDNSFPQGLEAIDQKYLKRLIEFGIKLDDQVVAAIRECGERRLAVCLNAMDQSATTINNPRRFFLTKLPKCEAEILGSRLPVFTASDEEREWFAKARERVAANQANLKEQSEPVDPNREAEMQRRREQAEQLRREIEQESEDAF